MNTLFRKVRMLLTVTAGCLMLLTATPVMAADGAATNTVETASDSTAEAGTENTSETAEESDKATSVVNVPTTEVKINQETGEYSFTLEVDSEDAYAGAEFGVICGQGVEITSITTNTGGSVTGPKEANGLVWFGFYDGEDSFSGTTVITVEGTSSIDYDSAIAIQDVKLYTVGDEEYTTTSLDCDAIVNLRTKTTIQMVLDTEENGISAIVLIVCFVVIVAAAAGALIYRKNRNKRNKQIREEKKNDFEKSEE